MTQKLESSIMQVNDLLLAGYRRVSKASDEIKSNLGLDPQQDIYAHLGIASVEEFIVLQSNNIQQRQSKTWNLSKIEQAVKIESVYIDAPNADAFVFEILSEGNVIFTFNLNRNKTPFDFPDAPLSSDLSIRIRAKTNINLVRIALKPIAILETILAEEDTVRNQEPISRTNS